MDPTDLLQTWLETTPTTWRLMLDGDDVFFSPVPLHRAMLRLPELPASLELRWLLPAEGSIGANITLALFPELDFAVVSLMGNNHDGLKLLWEAIQSAKGVKLPRLDNRSYGDFTLEIDADVPLAISMALQPELVPSDERVAVAYRYNFVEGRLTNAIAYGPDTDFVLEVVARDEYYCETVETMSILEAMGGPTN